MQLTEALAELGVDGVYGHSRSGWTPPLELIDPPRPEKTSFSVSVIQAEGEMPVVVAKTGPEPRPFPDLTALDIDQVANRIKDLLP